MRSALVTAIIVLLAGPLSLIDRVEAQSPPHVFVGEAMVDGVRAPDGTVIRAVVNGRPLPRARTIVNDGRFTLIVEQPETAQVPSGSEEAVIDFAVGDFLADQSQPWRLGELTILTLTASSTPPVIPVEIDPALPERLVPGQEFLVTVRANTGFYRATGGDISVDFDPRVFAAIPESFPPATGMTRHIAPGPGNLRVDWTYEVPASTLARDGELASLPLRVRESAPSGNAALSITAGMTGPDERPFQLEPDRFTTEVRVVSTAADLNGDDEVDFADLAALGSAWGKSRGESGFLDTYDLDGDGRIWIGDLGILLQSYPDAPGYSGGGGGAAGGQTLRDAAPTVS